MINTMPMPSAAPIDLRATVILRRPEEGEQLDVLGNRVTITLNGDDSAGAFSLVLYGAAPRSGPPPHRHRTGDELFIVLDDGLEFFDGTQWTAAASGTVVLIPRDVVHTFRNTTGGIVRTWVMSLPAGFDRFMQEFASLLNAMPARMPEPAQVTALYERHGIEAVA